MDGTFRLLMIDGLWKMVLWMTYGMDGIWIMEHGWTEGA
jgi:hypothetical protein